MSYFDMNCDWFVLLQEPFVSFAGIFGEICLCVERIELQKGRKVNELKCTLRTCCFSPNAKQRSVTQLSLPFSVLLHQALSPAVSICPRHQHMSVTTSERQEWLRKYWWVRFYAMEKDPVLWCPLNRTQPGIAVNCRKFGLNFSDLILSCRDHTASYNAPKEKRDFSSTSANTVLTWITWKREILWNFKCPSTAKRENLSQ